MASFKLTLSAPCSPYKHQRKVLKLHEISYSGALAREARAAEHHG